MARTIALLVALIGFSGVIGAGERLTNDSIIELQQSGLAEDLIIRKIETSESEYDLSTDGLKRLKTAGVSDNIIRAMIGRSPTAKPQPAPAPTLICLILA